VALRKKYPSHVYIAFTRSPRKVAAIHRIGFEALVGTGNPENDHQIITNAASVADIIINAADADDLALANAIIRGLEKSKKKLPVLIHTRLKYSFYISISYIDHIFDQSGTAVVVSGSTGEFEEGAKIWDVSSSDPSNPMSMIRCPEHRLTFQDSKVEDIKAIPFDQPHRDVDLA
jgi:hypothetical protein